jgi:hypothetical protein
MIGQIGDIFARSCEELTASVTKIASYACTIGITLLYVRNSSVVFVKLKVVNSRENLYQSNECGKYIYSVLQLRERRLCERPELIL